MLRSFRGTIESRTIEFVAQICRSNKLNHNQKRGRLAGDESPDWPAGKEVGVTMNELNRENELSRNPTRRRFLEIASGLGVSLMLPGMESRAAEQRGPKRASSFITLWLAGGPSQLETWDPHPGTKIGGPTKAIKTSLPGLQIAEHYPRVAEQMQSLSVVRSLVSKEGDHERATAYVKTGYRPDPTTKYPALGAVIAHERPVKGLEIPQYVSLGAGEWPGRGGYLGDQYDAFRIFNPGNGIRNMRAAVSGKRQKKRLDSLAVVSQAFSQGRQWQVKRSLHENTIERALKMMSSKQLSAFEIDEEPESTKRRYGDSQFGRGCLVARRLVEVGVRSIEVTLNGFDSHANNFEAQANRARDLDPAFAALIQDLKERDLFDSTIVLCIGEFGRTPQINPLDGRDHWPTGFPAVIGGGGIQAGRIIGKTDPTGEKTDPENPLTVPDLYATILHQLNIDPDKEMMTPIGRPLALCDGTPIKELIEA